MKRSERAYQVWQILLSLAYNRQTLIYQELSKLVGITHNIVIAMRYYLEPIMKFCKDNNLPPLTILIVNKRTGIPGTGLITIGNLNRDRERVYQKEWYKMTPIQISDLEPYT